MLFPTLLLALTGCTSDPAPPAPAAGDAPPQTVVVLIACTMRADRLHVYGNERQTSPYIDALAAGGARFERALTNAPWTKPALAALSTGRYPRALGIDSEGPQVNTDRGVHPDALTLGERFKAAGWTTVGATANPNANAVFGFDQGFDRYHEATGLWREEFVKVEGEDLVDAWLEQARGAEGPLYGQLVVVDTHSPLGDQRLRRAALGLPSVGEGSLLDRYDGAVSALDDVVERLDEGLKAMGREDRLLVFIADHGEGLSIPKYAGVAHGRYLYEPTVHIPWIVHGPGVAPGHVIGGLAQSVDLAPTLLELTGLAAEGELDGRSRADALRGLRSETGAEAIYTETRYGREDKARLTTDQWVYIHNYARDRKQVERRGEHELYPPDDGWQATNVHAANQEVSAALFEQLEGYRASAGAAPLIWEQSMSDDERARLEALGYVEPEAAPPEAPDQKAPDAP